MAGGDEMGTGKISVPPVSIPFTAASETVLSIFFAASLTVSTGDLRTIGEVLNRRAWRVMAVRNMIMCVRSLEAGGVTRTGRWVVVEGQLNAFAVFNGDDEVDVWGKSDGCDWMNVFRRRLA
jgi:hypothetical protein